MNKKSLAIGIVIVCLSCSIISFLVGLNIARESPEQNQNSQTQKQDEDSKYIGFYASTYYKNGGQVTNSLSLNGDHDCGSKSRRTCTWRVEGDKLITITRGSGGALGETIEQCKKAQKTEYLDVESDIIIFKEGDEELTKNGRNGRYVCMASPVIKEEYVILDDGSLYNDSGRGETYLKRG